MLKKIILSLLIISSLLSITGCGNKESVKNGSNSTSNNEISSEDSNKSKNVSINDMTGKTVEKGKYAVNDAKIKTMSGNQGNTFEQQVIICSFIDSTDNQIRTFFSTKYSIFHIYYLNDDTSSYMNVTDNIIDIYVSKEMSKNLLI